MASGGNSPAIWHPSGAYIQRPPTGLGAVDLALVCVFVIGLYTHFTIQVTAKIPIPSVIAGITGLILLWRRRDRISEAALSGFACVVLLYLASIFCATDMGYFGRRFNGLLQLTYSLTIGYALFLTVASATRRQIAVLCITLALIILVGCLLETYAGLRPLSDRVRLMLYSEGIYENDLRDDVLYGRVRPKFFASEPSSVTFMYTVLCFVWLVVSAWRWKKIAYLALIGLGLVAMPGPTLLLMVLLLVPYELFLGGRRGGGQIMDPGHLVKLLCIAAALGAGFVILATTLYATRLNDIATGNDASFFYRVRGPALAAVHILERYPLAGAGLTAEPFIEQDVINAYAQSPAFSTVWRVNKASELIINYFWLHWVYLGLVWGLVTFVALSLWLRALGVPSVMFCWIAWAILGQASGSYVGPLTWSVLFLAAAAAVLHERQPVLQAAPYPPPMPRPRQRPRRDRPDAEPKPVQVWRPETAGRT